MARKKNEAEVVITADTGKATKQVDGFNKKLGETGKVAEKSGGILGNAVKSLNIYDVAAAAATAALATFISVMSDSIDATNAQAKATVRLSFAFKKLSGDVEANIAAAQEFASAQQVLTGVGDESIHTIQALLLNMGVMPDQLNRTTEAALDTASAFDMSLDVSARNVAKTLKGTAGRLGDMIPGMRDLSKESLKAGGALSLIEKAVGGAAQAELKTYEGRVNALDGAWGDLKETLGATVTDSGSVNQALSNTQELLEGIDNVLKEAGGVGGFLERLGKESGAGGGLPGVVGFLLSERERVVGEGVEKLQKAAFDKAAKALKNDAADRAAQKSVEEAEKLKAQEKAEDKLAKARKAARAKEIAAQQQFSLQLQDIESSRALVGLEGIDRIEAERKAAIDKSILQEHFRVQNAGTNSKEITRIEREAAAERLLIVETANEGIRQANEKGVTDFLILETKKQLAAQDRLNKIAEAEEAAAGRAAGNLKKQTESFENSMKRRGQDAGFALMQGLIDGIRGEEDALKNTIKSLLPILGALIGGAIGFAGGGGPAGGFAGAQLGGRIGGFLGSNIRHTGSAGLEGQAHTGVGLRSDETFKVLQDEMVLNRQAVQALGGEGRVMAAQAGIGSGGGMNITINAIDTQSIRDAFRRGNLGRELVTGINSRRGLLREAF